ncbi:MAG: pitrilysin family protein, partial [Cyanobacteria bacterium P01_F01_bin.42]
MTQSAPKTSSLGDTTAAQRLNPQRFVLDNGIVLLVTPNPTADIVAARLFLQAGLRRETPDDWGLSHLVASVITKGTQSHSASEIAHIVESAGASLGTDSSPDYFLVSLKTVSEDFETVLAVAAEILRSPTFPERELETERKVTLQAIKNRAEQPLSLCLRPLRTALHGDHPYSQTSYGVQETVESLQVNDLHRFHQQYFNPAEMVVSIAGNITPEQAKTLVSQYFGDWNSDHASASGQTARVSQPLSSLQVLTEAQDT